MPTPAPTDHPSRRRLGPVAMCLLTVVAGCADDAEVRGAPTLGLPATSTTPTSTTPKSAAMTGSAAMAGSAASTTAYLELRGLDATVAWRDTSAHGSADWARQPGEDFAEVMVAIWSSGRWMPRTEVAAEPTVTERAAILDLVGPPVG